MQLRGVHCRAFSVADSRTVRIAKPEPDCSADARAEHASEHDAALAGAERCADQHAKLGAVWVPVALAYACAEQRSRVQLAAAFSVADSRTVRIAEPEPDCSADARAEHASEHDVAELCSYSRTVERPIESSHAFAIKCRSIQLLATVAVTIAGTLFFPEHRVVSSADQNSLACTEHAADNGCALSGAVAGPDPRP